MPNKFSTPSHKTSLLVGTLFASAILNLFLVGVLAGGVPHTKHRPFAPMALASPHGEYLVDGMTRYLSQADAGVFSETVKSQAEALKQAHDQVRQATKDVASVFEQEPPDQDSLKTALDHLSDSKASVDAIVKNIVLDADVKLSPEGRHRLAELTK